MINIRGLDKAKVLCALYSDSSVRGMGFLQAREELSLDACREIVDPWFNVLDKDSLMDRLVALIARVSEPANGLLERAQKAETNDEVLDLIVECSEIFSKPVLRFDYLFGRVMKVNLSGDWFDEQFYDRDNGHGVAARAVERVRKGEIR